MNLRGDPLKSIKFECVYTKNEKEELLNKQKINKEWTYFINKQIEASNEINKSVNILLLDLEGKSAGLGFLGPDFQIKFFYPLKKYTLEEINDLLKNKPNMITKVLGKPDDSVQHINSQIIDKWYFSVREDKMYSAIVIEKITEKKNNHPSKIKSVKMWKARWLGFNK